MTNFIGFEYLLACALVIRNCQSLTMAELDEFRALAESEFSKRNIDAVFLISSKYADGAMHEYPGLFRYAESDGTKIMRVPGVTNDDLTERFLAYMSCDTLHALIEVAREQYPDDSRFKSHEQ